MSETEEPQSKPEGQTEAEPEAEGADSEVMARFRWATSQGGPTQLLDFLYIGNYADAGNFERLKELGITHVVNCAPVKQTDESPYSEDVGIKGYMQIETFDKIDYDILQHYETVKTFVDTAKKDGGKILVHCAMGINRSGAICTAYIVDTDRKDLITVMKMVKEKHGIIVLNKGFQKQLMEFAKERDLFVLKKPEKKKEEEQKGE